MAIRPQNDYYASLPPFKSKEESQVSYTLMLQTAPSEALREIRPWSGVEQIPLFRPRFGYRTEAPGVLDVLDLDRANIYNTNYTGGAWDINASSRNTGASGQW